MIALNLPNKLTVGRILIIPVILVLMSYQTKLSCGIAGILFILAGVTDLFDGYLARKANQVTSIGIFLDPLADKLLICSVLVMFVQLGWVSGWIVILMICREMMVTGLRAIAAEQNIVIAADSYGKLKTVLQIVAIVPLMWHYTWFAIPMDKAGNVLLLFALALTLFSGYNYFMNFFRTCASGANANM